MTLRWIAEYRGEDGVAFRIGRDGDELVAEWPNVVTLRARRDGSSHVLTPADGADPRDVDAIRRGSAEALLGHLRGELSVHAAAVAIGETAIVFLANSGGGKSTLCAAASARPNARFIADDVVALDRRDGVWRASSRERDHWLHDDARAALGLEIGEGKAAVAPGRNAEDALPIAAFVALEFGDEEQMALSRCGLVDAFAIVIPQVVRFVLEEPEVVRTEIDLVSHLVEHVPVHRLVRPRNLRRLSESVDIVASIAKKGPDEP